jgi:hypothetical protein
MSEEGFTGFGNITGVSTETLVLRELLKTVSSGFTDFTYKGILKLVFNVVGKVVGIFVLQYLTRDPSKIFTLFKSALIFIFYRRKRYSTMSRTREGSICSIIRKKLSGGTTDKDTRMTFYSGFPIYLQALSGEDEFTYLPYIQTSIFAEAEEEAIKKELEAVCLKKVTVIEQHLGSVYTPKTLYPSENYKNISDIVKTHFETCELLGNRMTRPILINGRPGLGKTDSGDYIASLNIVNKVVKIPMTMFMNKNFKEIADGLKSDGTVVYIFDELDKWLENGIKNGYYKYISGTKLSPLTFPQFYAKEKEEFLYHLLELIDTDRFPYGSIIIFCSNNFDTIFSGIEMTHFHSLQTRIMNFTFHPCDKKELCGYMDYINQKFRGSIYERKEMEDVYKKVREDLCITYRKVALTLLEVAYDFELFVEKINEYSGEKDVYTPNARDMRDRIEREELDRKLGLILEENKKHEKVKQEEEKQEEEKQEEEKQEEEKQEEEKETCEYCGHQMYDCDCTVCELCEERREDCDCGDCTICKERREDCNCEFCMGCHENNDECICVKPRDKSDKIDDLSEKVTTALLVPVDSPPLSPSSSSRKESAVVIGGYLTKCEKAVSKIEKTKICISLFRYLTTHVCDEILKNVPFRETVRRKIEELRRNNIEGEEGVNGGELSLNMREMGDVIDVLEEVLKKYE